MSRFVKVAVLVVVAVATTFAAGCKSSGCSSCGAKVILPETAIKQA